VKKIDHSAHRSQMSVKIAEQSDEPKCSKCRKLMAEYFARTRLSLALCGLLQGLMVAVPIGA
jgi:hypothetical protein